MSPSLPSDPRSSTLYADWVREHAPLYEPHAAELLNLLDEHRGRDKPQRLLDGLERRLDRLDLPREQLPWVWDTVGHRLLGAWPRQAGAAYTRAREAEERYGLATGPHHTVENTLLFARYGSLPAKEVAAQQRRLDALFTPRESHRELCRLLKAWAAGGAPFPGETVTRLRASVRGAGLGPEETARVLGEVLAGARGGRFPEKVLGAAEKVFTEARPEEEARRRLVDLFPRSPSNGASWLRILETVGVVDDMAAGRIVPARGFAEWLSEFARTYNYRLEGRYLHAGRMPEELHALVPRLAPRLREEAAPVRLHESPWSRRHRLDLRLLNTCLTEGVRVEDPGPDMRRFSTRDSADAIPAVLSDPVFGPRLESGEGGGNRREAAGEPARRPPEGPRLRVRLATELPPATHTRVAGLAERIATSGLGGADEALAELDSSADHPVLRALGGVDDVLGDLDLVRPLARTLRFGVPAEYAWPAFEEAVAEMADRGDEVVGATSTWPVLTLYGRARAIAVDHEGRRAECSFVLPAEADRVSVHHVGGDFLVAWTHGPRPRRSAQAQRAFWRSAPEDVFDVNTSEDRFQGVRLSEDELGYVFEAPGGGRYDTERILRPGDRGGVHGTAHQLSDGDRVWVSHTVDEGVPVFQELDPASGRPSRTSTPAFLAPEALPEDSAWTRTHTSLVRLPEDMPGSPLGSAGRTAGFRTSQTPRGWLHDAESFTIEGVDGRRATTAPDPSGWQISRAPWGIARMPGGDAEGLLSSDRNHDHLVLCRSGDDSALMWRAWAHPRGHAALPKTTYGRPLVPPPAFWHFLAPRDPEASRALRDVDERAARRLLDTALHAADAASAVREAVAELLPEGSDERLVSGEGGIVWAVLWAARLRRRREALSRRIGYARDGALVRPVVEVPEAHMREVLTGLMELPGRVSASATLTAVAADGAFLRGAVGEEVRRASPPEQPGDWPLLFHRTASAAWCLVAGSPSEEERDALVALLRTWAEQPFSERGTAWRRGRAGGEALLPLVSSGDAVITGYVDKTFSAAVRPAPKPGDPLVPYVQYSFLQPETAPSPEDASGVETVRIDRDEATRLRGLLEGFERHGPLRLTPKAVEAFVRRTGVRRTVAAFVLTGRAGQRGTGPSTSSKTVLAEFAADLRRCGDRGLNRLAAAAVPDDPAELWAPGGDVAAAERMAGAWVEHVGHKSAVDEKDLDLLDRDLGLGGAWMRALADPRSFDRCTADLRRAPVQDRYGHVNAHPVLEGGGYGRQIYAFRGTDNPYDALASLLSWALTQLPVGHPHTAGVPELHERLVARLRAPELLIPLEPFLRSDDARAWAELADTRVLPAVPYGPGEHNAWGYEPRDLPEPRVHDDGVLLVNAEGPMDHPLLRPAGLFEPGALERTVKVLDQLGLEEIEAEVRRFGTLCEGGLARMVARSASTPVPEGGFEADPRLSAPELVGEVADEFGTDPDAASLYLQLLTLARPTDRNVRRWNGWSADQHKKVAARLVETGRVVREKRPRAGRTLFVPGGWVTLKAPNLPMEASKLAPYAATPADKKELRAPLRGQLPVAPLHEMFAEAWRTRGRD